MSLAKQKHPAVPTSDTPPIPEWADHYWYVLRSSALQARPDFTDNEAKLLVSSFEAYKLTTPCPKCRGHYASDWKENPFTAEHAKDPLAAMHWVEELRRRIEERNLSSPEGPTSDEDPAGAAAEPAEKTVRFVASTKAAPRVASAKTLQSRMIRPRRSISAVSPASAAQRRLAIQSSIQQTSANRRGARGCNCGKKKRT